MESQQALYQEELEGVQAEVEQLEGVIREFKTFVIVSELSTAVSSYMQYSYNRPQVNKNSMAVVKFLFQQSWFIIIIAD